MEEIRVVRAQSNDAFTVAALHLQHDRAAGATPQPGFIDAFADWWLSRLSARPAWVAFGPTGDALGLLAAAVLDVRPRPGRPAAQLLMVETLFVPVAWRRRGIGSRLLVEAQSWSRTHGMTELRIPAGPGVTGILDALGCDAEAGGVRVWRPGVRAVAAT